MVVLRTKQRRNAALVSNTLSSADYNAVMVARTAVIAPTAKVLRIEARDEELPFAVRQSLSLATVAHAGPARTGHMRKYTQNSLWPLRLDH